MSRVVDITNYDEHQSMITNNDRCVIFFGSRNCPHCRDMMRPYEDLAAKYPNVRFGHVEVTKVEVDNIDGVPVFVGYKMHVPVDTVLGADPKALTNMVQTKLA